MSSHHIVKDTQEPALIIANGEACSTTLLNQLLEWAPTVMVLDGAIFRVLELGIKVDVVLGDFDRAFNPEVLLENQSIEIVHAPDQNKTDLEKGIEWLINKGHKAINIVWATGKRADHTFTNIVNLVKFKNLATLVMYDDYSKVFCLNQHYTKWYKKNTPISLIPIGKVNGITTSGLLYNIVNYSMETGVNTGSSNEVAEDGFVTITHTGGNLLLMECIDL